MKLVTTLGHPLFVLKCACWGPAIRAGIAVLASIILCGNATAASTRYAVRGLAIGTQLSFDSPLYREYTCSPSDQADGFTWCQKTRSERERRGSYTATYSILHSRDGKVLYVNRSLQPAFFDSDEVEDDIRRYSRKIGESPRIMKIPRRNGFPHGIIAVWGTITLQQLDQESSKAVAGGTGPHDGLLIDFLGDVARSANEGLAIYRIDGGSGFLWAASFDQNGRGNLRLTAVDTSEFLSLPSVQQRPPQSTDARTAPEATRTETLERLQAELATASKTVAKFEEVKAAVQAMRIEAAKLDVALARLEAHRTVIDVKSFWWENALYGSVGGLLVALTGSTIGFVVNRRKASVGKRQGDELAASSVNAAMQSQNGKAESSLSPEISNAEFAGELQEQVATINAAKQHGAGGYWRLLSPQPRLELIWKSRRP